MTKPIYTKREIELKAALQLARRQLVTLGGDSGGLVTRANAEECGVDMIHWETLRIIDDALALM